MGKKLMDGITGKLLKTRVLHDGWEMDNEAWATIKNDQVALRTTSHGEEVELTRDVLLNKIAETKQSLQGLEMLAAISHPDMLSERELRDLQAAKDEQIAYLREKYSNLKFSG